MKRVLFFIIMVCCCLNMMAETINVTVKGTASVQSKTVTVLVNAARRSAVTVSVVDGRFTYTAPVERESFLTVGEDGSKNIVWAVADGSNVTVDMTTESANGTALTDKLTSVLAAVKSYVKNETDCRIQAQKEQDEGRAAMLRAKARESKRAYRAVLDSAIMQNKDNCLPALLMFMYAVGGVREETLTAYALGDYSFTMHPLFGSVKAYAQQVAKNNAYVGKKFYDFSANDVNGKAHKLSEYIGKKNYVLIDFWASWCGPCMAEMPALKEAVKRYGKVGFDIVGISLDNDAARWQGAIKNTELDWMHLSNLQGWDEPALSWYGVRSIPANFLCNSDGVIVAVNLRGESLLEKLEEIYDVK